MSYSNVEHTTIKFRVHIVSVSNRYLRVLGAPMTRTRGQLRYWTSIGLPIFLLLEMMHFSRKPMCWGLQVVTAGSTSSSTFTSGGEPRQQRESIFPGFLNDQMHGFWWPLMVNEHAKQGYTTTCFEAHRFGPLLADSEGKSCQLELFC